MPRSPNPSPSPSPSDRAKARSPARLERAFLINSASRGARPTFTQTKRCINWRRVVRSDRGPYSDQVDDLVA
jgi:hypothetical protein